MAWVRFVADWAWPPQASAHVAYKAGMRCSVPRLCADAAIGAGAAEEIHTPRRAVAERLKANPYWTEAADGDRTAGSR